MTVRRIKTYSAESGYVYQYYFEELRSPHRRDAHGRELTGSEQYAAVKMRLFRFFDETKDAERDSRQVEVTPQNIHHLLAFLDID